jgi:hypothetical protein
VYSQYYSNSIYKNKVFIVKLDLILYLEISNQIICCETYFGSALFADSSALLYKLMARFAQQGVFSSWDSLVHCLSVENLEIFDLSVSWAIDSSLLKLLFNWSSFL